MHGPLRGAGWAHTTIRQACTHRPGSNKRSLYNRGMRRRPAHTRHKRAKTPQSVTLSPPCVCRLVCRAVCKAGGGGARRTCPRGNHSSRPRQSSCRSHSSAVCRRSPTPALLARTRWPSRRDGWESGCDVLSDARDMIGGAATVEERDVRPRRRHTSERRLGQTEHLRAGARKLADVVFCETVPKVDAVAERVSRAVPAGQRRSGRRLR
eukprot:1428818-Prymnesium_polylepis.2